MSSCDQILALQQPDMLEQESTVASPPKLYVKIRNVTGLYRHVQSGRYYGVKNIKGKRKERSLGTADRAIAERRLREWVANLCIINAESERTTIRELITKLVAANQGKSTSTRTRIRCIIKQFEQTWHRGMNVEVRDIRPSHLDEWLAEHERRLKNTSYNIYAGFLKQLFDIAMKDRIIVESPFKDVKTPWKRPQIPRRIVPTVEQFQAIVDCIRSQPFTDHAQNSADFVEFLGLAGLGQAEASSLRWGHVDWKQNRLFVRRHKTDTQFYVPIYPHLRPLLEKLRAGNPRVHADALVFKIKDAKKALKTACRTLELPAFSQRNMRQSLIMRLWKAGVDKKLIAKWQGHQDGGQLIIDTYTEVFGDDDADYELQQLAKIGQAALRAA